MSATISQQPVQSVTKLRHSLHTLLRTVPHGTPYRTPDRRRFGPLGSSRRTPATRQIARDGSYVPDGISSQDTPRLPGNRSHGVYEPAHRTEVEENNIKEITKKVWRVFRLTPLYNYQTKKSDYQLYSRSLSSHVAADTKKGVFIDTDIPGDATVGMFSGLEVGPDDPKAMLIEIKGKARNSSESKLLLQAILFSTDLEYNPLRASIQDNFTYFSSMLLRGPEALSQTLQNWLEVQFDCRVIPQTFPSHELAFMTAMFTGLGEEEVDIRRHLVGQRKYSCTDHKPVELVYSVPKEVEGLSDITYSTDAKDCLRLWNRVRCSTDEDRFTREEASKFISGLESHFYECFNIKLSAMSLSTIGTSVAFVGTNGKIKLYTKNLDNVLKVLRNLTDLALDQLKIC